MGNTAELVEKIKEYLAKYPEGYRGDADTLLEDIYCVYNREKSGGR